MKQNAGSKEKKGFISKLVDKLDRKLEEKSKKASCCVPKDNKKGGSCC